MAKRWREFELLVTRIEQTFGPFGVKVKSPDMIPDLVTGNLREVDASIRMPLGSTEMLVTLECRDRRKHDDISWIDILHSKQQSIGASKTIAVSRSGFSSAALERAALWGIDTRLVKDITMTDVSDWLAVGELTKIEQHGRVLYSYIQLESGTSGGKVEIDNSLYTKGQDIMNTPYFISTSDERRLTLNDILMMNITPDHPLYAGLPTDGTRARRKFILRIPPGTLHTLTTNGIRPIGEIHLEVEVWLESTVVPPSALVEYSGSAQSLAQRIEFSTGLWGQANVLALQRDSRTGEIDVQFHQTPTGNAKRRRATRARPKSPPEI